MTTLTISSLDILKQQLDNQDALLLLFGGAHCGVCQSIKPRLEQMLRERFPKMQLFYVDCEAQPEIAASHGVFSLPVVELYFHGQAFGRFSKVFSMGEIAGAIARPYALLD